MVVVVVVVVVVVLSQEQQYKEFEISSLSGVLQCTTHEQEISPMITSERSKHEQQ